MEDVPIDPFLDAWHEIVALLSLLFFLAGIVTYVVYHMRVAAIKDYKLKYDFINANEIKWYKAIFYLYGLSVALIINIYGAGKVNIMGVWFYVRIFMSVAGGTLIAYIANLVLEYYYPSRLSRKLSKWRNMPRINPTTGNKMRILSEEEEDVHLDEGQQAEEGAFSIDYDVWVDEKSGEVKIEKYQGHLSALQCGNCGFYTMKVKKEEVAKSDDEGHPIEIIKHYQCTYCKSIRATQFKISHKERDDYVKEKMSFGRNTKGIDVVKVEIHSGVHGKQLFEFESVEEAQKFLEEFDLDKVA